MLSLLSATLTFSVFVVPTFSQNGSATDPQTVSLNSSSFEKHNSKKFLLKRKTALSNAEYENLSKQTNWAQNFGEFQKRFAQRAIDPEHFTLTDVYNLFSGFEQTARSLVNVANDLQKRVNAANEIFPVEDNAYCP
ncbi:DUF240 domain-containing protein [Mycoplasmoides pneumoniae]|uniref:DUF240 domain-containing protein n=1 Tax=Mycoplasmoides pneumoniae TaxID=2104 RepID=UPI00101D997B|nr:hypothetical protein [Mycoplasmoides pneumoniae]QHR08254.1 hypothetical protein FA925_02930 [Mycoplasmoides pneumoniae]QHR10357.1 hypothetical protein FA928_02930 [Mycoplasmoides pneumoniae]QHR13155.1 hypothetical protein FA932_02930 [Mycoplasmoides pneumoniae]QHR14550.1 hypothetical protein FA934_02930 [Mycoplasmoides pneumoniae]QHR16648.1 hypothetical protein FA937_02930 [Mycoplasmoides pneumoniae]